MSFTEIYESVLKQQSLAHLKVLIKMRGKEYTVQRKDYASKEYDNDDKKELSSAHNKAALLVYGAKSGLSTNLNKWGDDSEDDAPIEDFKINALITPVQYESFGGDETATFGVRLVYTADKLYPGDRLVPVIPNLDERMNKSYKIIGPQSIGQTTRVFTVYEAVASDEIGE